MRILKRFFKFISVFCGDMSFASNVHMASLRTYANVCIAILCVMPTVIVSQMIISGFVLHALYGGFGSATYIAENSRRSSGWRRMTSFVYAFRTSARSGGTTICEYQVTFKMSGFWIFVYNWCQQTFNTKGIIHIPTISQLKSSKVDLIWC